jgi:hypothetical protein
MFQASSLYLADLYLNASSSQAITFNPISDRTYTDASFEISANSDSELPVSFKILSGLKEAFLEGNTITPIGLGEVTVAAIQMGNATYKPAPAKTITFSINQGTQTITLNDLANLTISSSRDLSTHPLKVVLSASSSANLPVEFS